MMKGGHGQTQISYMTLIGMHSTMHLVHPNYYVYVCVWVCMCVGGYAY